MNLARYVRRHVYGAPQAVTLDVGPGLAETARAEVALLSSRLVSGPSAGAMASRSGRLALRRADYRGVVELAGRATTVHDLRLEIAAGTARNVEELDALLLRTPWPAFFAPGSAVELAAESHDSALYHRGLILERASLALAASGVRSEASEGMDSGRVRLAIVRDRVSVDVSLAGAPLWKRGYRTALQASAPLREDLAQAALRWTRELAPSEPDFLLLPFCGTGTFLFEGLIALLDVPPLAFGRPYAFERFAFGAPPSFAHAKRRLLGDLAARVEPVRLGALLVDGSLASIESARANWDSFRGALGWSEGTPCGVRFLRSDAFATAWRELLPESARRVLLPLNPPYGRRLRVASARLLYERISGECARLGASLARSGGGLSGCILCPDEATWRAFLARARPLRTRTRHIGQGGLDVRVCNFST